jgi:hypothetical protein
VPVLRTYSLLLAMPSERISLPGAKISTAPEPKF